jgi:hypothetical protein
MLCFECSSDQDIHQHHVVPKSRGGTKTIPLCRYCHHLVHDMSVLVLSVQKQKKKLTDSQICEIINLANDAVSHRNISLKVGCSVNMVRKVCDRNGIKSKFSHEYYGPRKRGSPYEQELEKSL